MVVRTIKNGNPFGNEAPTKDDLNDTFDAMVSKCYSDNTGGSIAGSTSTAETDLATLTILQNDLGNNATLLINSGIHGIGNSSSAAFNLYVGGVLQKSVGFGFNGANRGSSGSAITYIATGIDTTSGNVIVKVTGTSGDTTVTSTCTGLTVLGKTKN